MPASSVRRRRVLIVAFLLPNSIEFHTDESSVHGSSEKWTAPPSPELKSQLTEQQLADMLSVRLQLAKSQQDKVRLDPTRALSSPSTSRRPSINSATRERINMAELMAEASGSGSAYLQPHASSAIATSGPPSPKVSEIPDELVSAPARVPVSSVKSSMSDHGRHAGDEGDNAAVSSSGNSGAAAAVARGARSPGRGQSFFKPLTPAQQTPSRAPTPRMSGTQAPISIISDLAVCFASCTADDRPSGMARRRLRRLRRKRTFLACPVFRQSPRSPPQPPHPVWRPIRRWHLTGPPMRRRSRARPSYLRGSPLALLALRCRAKRAMTNRVRFTLRAAAVVCDAPAACH